MKHINNILLALLHAVYIGGGQALLIYYRQKEYTKYTLPFLLYAISWTLANLVFLFLTIRAIL